MKGRNKPEKAGLLAPPDQLGPLIPLPQLLPLIPSPGGDFPFSQVVSLRSGPIRILLVVRERMLEQLRPFEVQAVFSQSAVKASASFSTTQPTFCFFQSCFRHRRHCRRITPFTTRSLCHSLNLAAHISAQHAIGSPNQPSTLLLGVWDRVSSGDCPVQPVHFS